MNSASQRLIDPQVLSRLSNLELLARTVVEGMMTGLHRSPHFGFSQEFAEYRAYNEGDDLRFVDWNVYARNDRMYIKRYRGDTNTTLTLLLDASGSMAFGGSNKGPDQTDVSKFDYARYLCAALAYLASRQHDGAGLVVFDNAVRDQLPASTRPDALHRLLAKLESQQAQSDTDIEGALDGLLMQSRRRGLVAVVSDFYTDVDPFLAALQPLVFSGQDLALFHIVDAQELAPEYDSVVALRDLESGEQLDVDPDWLREGYREQFSAHCTALAEAARGCGADYMQVRTDEPLDAALQRYLLFRQRKL